MARLQEKMKEYEAVTALEKASALLVKRIEGLGDDCEDMAAAGVVCGQVLEQWPNMFRILDLFLSNRDQAVGHQENTTINASPSAPDAGARLVRIPIEELQTAK